MLSVLIGIDCCHCVQSILCVITITLQRDGVIMTGNNSTIQLNRSAKLHAGHIFLSSIPTDSFSRQVTQAFVWVEKGSQRLNIHVRFSSLADKR